MTRKQSHITFALIVLLAASSWARPASAESLSANEQYRLSMTPSELARVCDQKFVFDPDVIQEVSKEAANLPADQQVDFIQNELARIYPGKVDPAGKNKVWLFDSLGGSIFQMLLLWGNSSEYLAITGGAVKTSGFYGRYKYDVWDFVFAGNMGNACPDSPTPVEHHAGEFYYQKHDDASSYRLDDGTWMIEYGRGPLWSGFYFGVLAGTLYVTQDWTTFGQLMKETARMNAKALLHSDGKQAPPFCR